MTTRSLKSPLVTHTLDNGLQVFLREKHDAEVASFWTWYRVGSRNETPGLTGMSHWVEHMQFKGTPTLPKGAIFGDVSRHGGSLNAMTSMDWTAYFETLPVGNIDLSLQIESDRMSNSIFDPAETESERTVILSERQGAENRPTYHLLEELYGTAFQAHPYRHMVIGYEHDLRQITRNDLYEHYKTYYVPNNAYIAAVGDFDAADMLERINATFGDIPPGNEVPRVTAKEPPQRGERRVTIRRPSPASYMFMAYRMPEATHPDIPAILVADALLSGAKPMGMGGGSAMGQSARLYRGLVSTGLARSAGSSAGLHLDANLWTFTATALPDIEGAAIEHAVEAEIERLKHDAIGEEEFIKARKQIRAQYVYSNETVTAQAFWLGQMELVDHAARVDTLSSELEAVTPEDVQRVMRTWLVPDQRTVGWQIPEDAQAAEAGVEVDATSVDIQSALPSVTPVTWGVDGSVGSTYGLERRELENGIVVLAQPRPGDASVDATISVRASNAAVGEQRPGLASLTARMLNRGTQNHTFDQFTEAVDSLGAVVQVGADRESTEVSFHSLTEDLESTLDLASEVLLTPTFPEDELDRVREQTLTGIREQDSNTGAMASKALRALLYPEDHPFRQRVAGEIESVSGFTREDLQAFYARAFAPDRTTIAIVGGIAGIDEAVSAIERTLGGWRASASDEREVPNVAPVTQTERSFLGVPGTSQADIAMGYPTLPRSHDDYYALNVANVILGQLGLMGRLGANVRDAQGLAYYASSRLSGGKVNSMWSSRAGVDPENVDRAVESILDEVRRLQTDLVEEQELADAKSFLIGSLPIGLESQGGVVNLLLLLEEFNLGVDYLDRYPEILGALTREDLLRAAQTHLDPARLAIGIAGPENGTNHE